MKNMIFRLKPVLAIFFGYFSFSIIFAGGLALGLGGSGSLSLLASLLLLPFRLVGLTQYPVINYFLIYFVISSVWYLIISIIFYFFNRNEATHVKNIHWLDIVLLLVFSGVLSYIFLSSISPTYLGPKPSSALDSPFSSYADRQQAYNDYIKTNFCPLNNNQSDNFCYTIDQGYDGTTQMILPSGKLIILSLNKSIYDESKIILSKNGVLTPNSFQPTIVMEGGVNQRENYWTQSYSVINEAPLDITVQRFDGSKPFTVHFTLPLRK